MKFFMYMCSIIGLMLGASLDAMAPAQLSSLQQEFKAVMSEQNFDRAQEIVSSLENAGARAIALPLRAQLEVALKEYAISFGANLSSEFVRVKQQLLAAQDQNRKNQVLIDQLRKQLATAGDEGSNLQQQFNRLQKEFQNAVRERAGTENNLRNLNVTLQNQVNEYLKQINQIQQEFAARDNRLNQELQTARRELNTIRVERDQAQQQLKTTREVQTAARTDFDVQLNQVRTELQANYDARVKQLQENLQVANNTINSLQDQLRTKSADAALTSENNRLSTENRALQNRITQLENDLSTAIANSAAQSQQQAVEQNQALSQRKQLEGELAAERISVVQLQKDIIELTNLIKARDAQIEQANKDLKAQFELVEQVQDNAQSRIAEKDKRIIELQELNAQLNEQLQQAAQGQPVDLVAQNNLLADKVASLQSQLSYKEDFLRSAREYADLKQKEKQKATFDLIDVTRERDTAVQQLKQARENSQKNIARLEAEKQQLEQQIRQLNADLQQRIAQVEQTFTKKIQDAVAQKDADITKLEDRILSYTTTINDLTLQLEQAQTAPLKETKEIEQLKQQLTNLKKASEDVAVLLQRGFLPDMSGIKPVVTSKEEQALQNKLNELIKLLTMQ
jgi:chromosome segregation ATPase